MTQQGEINYLALLDEMARIVGHPHDDLGQFKVKLLRDFVQKSIEREQKLRQLCRNLEDEDFFGHLIDTVNPLWVKKKIEEILGESE